jgi:hypothetical protein
MKNTIFVFSTFILGISALADSGLQSNAMQGQAIVSACKLSDEDFEKIKNTSLFLERRQSHLKVCGFKNQSELNSGEKFFLEKWGSTICKDLMDPEYLSSAQFSRQCRYQKLISTQKLNVAEAMAVAGYTAHYYNYLKPEVLSIKPDQPEYEGFDVFNQVLKNAVKKLGRYPEFQYNEIVYRGTSLHGRTFSVSKEPFSFSRWSSSSCVKEIAYGPELIEVSEEKKAEIIAEEGEDSPGLEYLLMERDPKSIPAKMTTCQSIYFSENQRPPMTPDSHFGDGDLKFIIHPPTGKISKRVAIYELSDRRGEAEVLFPPDTQFTVEEVILPNDPNGDRINTQVILKEL